MGVSNIYVAELDTAIVLTWANHAEHQPNFQCTLSLNSVN